MKIKKSHSLRTFTIITIAVSIICCIAIIFIIFLSNMSRMLYQSEEDHILELENVIKGSLTTTLNNLHSTTLAWVTWEEMYAYLIGENNDFIEKNLIDGNALTAYGIDFIIIKDGNGEDLYSGSRVTKEGEMELVLPDDLYVQADKIASSVLAKQNLSSYPLSNDTGFLISGNQSYMVCVLPLPHRDPTLPPFGTLTFLVEFGNEQLKELTNLPTTQFYISNLLSSSSESPHGYQTREQDTISSHTLISNKGSGRDTLLNIEHPRNLYASGWPVITKTIGLLLSVVGFFMIALFLLFHRFLLRPLGMLTHEICNADENSQLDLAKYKPYQELYTLSFAIDQMRKGLKQSHLTAEQSEKSINVLKSILNGLDAYLYVSDTVTDEILFINENMKTHFGLKNEGVGKTCWKLLQSGFDRRCDFCPCYQLDQHPDVPVVWEEHNTVTNHYYRNTDCYIDWIGGRKAHLQHSVDITDIKMAQFALDQRLHQQALMASISQSFITDQNIDMLITNALKEVGDFMGACQALFFEMEEDGLMLICKNEWANSPDVERRMGAKLQLSSSLLSIISGITSKQGFYMTPENPMVKKMLEPYRVNYSNYICVPILLGDKMYGILDFSKENDTPWTESDINLALLLASLLSGVFVRRSMEDQLRSLSSIVESSSQLILTTSSNGDMDYINPAAMEITGYTEEEILQGGLLTIFDEQTTKDIKDHHIPMTLKNGTSNFELNLLCKDGSRRIIEVSSFTTGVDSTKVCGISRDVTEMRALEAELIASKELAEQGSRSKSEFLSRMSHEMRTPMNAIIGMTNIAKGSDDPAKKEYCLDRIDNASRHLLGVINDILDMSKIEANKFELSFSEFGFEKMLLNVLDVVNFRMDEKQQQFSLFIDPCIPTTIIGDEQRLAQVITNLLTNAVKFTPELGAIQLKADVLEKSNPDQLTLKVEITDSGIGISAEQQAKLFRSFEQADGSIARKFGGTGLGLAISKRIIELMNGEIWIESELGKGSTFAFTIQVKPGEQAHANQMQKYLDYTTLNIMAVDDSSEIRDYFKHVMDSLGIPCVVASGGREALSLVEHAEKSFDILFVDWKMPIMNGIELTKHLREMPEQQPIIIMISVAEWSEIEEEAILAGVNGFVPKPLFPSLLMNCINQNLGTSIMEETDSDDAGKALFFEGKTALLAEDVDINREIILTVLADTKLAIECAENGREAVEMFSAFPDKYDIIFMDVHMPEVDGLDATRQIRALPGHKSKEIPIVAMTANVFQEDVAKCLEAGMNDHIGKPIDFDALNRKLQKYLK